ncbi:hypothetical protein IF188_09670 [Microbacterium sp. NEAU-LLC]|uniref:Phage gp6-like head-tail connector protein n=1 Tax=Microbacterium helvum TaxID=2773713 RepID=A0ABR8NQC0_9MICO|nr:hypothetical protein [Microbacterium helvum]MBD3941962.1 hypothetical protein [Microbacterium helvum]
MTLTPEALPVLAAITIERDRQLAELRWTPTHDDEHGAGHLVALVYGHLQAAGDDYDGQGMDRTELVKAAALLVAAIEVIDRSEV